MNTGEILVQDEILGMFGEKADKPTEFPPLNAAILDLAQLLAESRRRLSKENLEMLVRIGGVLYKEGGSRFQGKSDVDAILKQFAANYRRE